MASVEPIPDAPAAIVTAGDDRYLAFADFHAGLESAVRYERGVNIDSRGPDRRERVRSLVEESAVDEVIVVGDFMHSIGGPGGAERGEIEVLLEELSLPVTVVKGNHDGDLEEWAAVTVTDSTGLRIGDVGFAHGHTWPAPAVLTAEVICIGHEHPMVRLRDEVGGARTERVWLRGDIDATPFEDRSEHGALESEIDGELVVFPAFNELCGGTWVNEGSDFLAPFLPAAIPEGQAYLLDGTRLGRYDDL